MAQEKKAPDWDLIEVDYRAGIKTLRQIAEEHGITHGAVNKRAKVKGWTRDLKAKIQAQAEAKVSKAAVSKEVSAQRLATETEVVEANAELQYRIRMQHRGDIASMRQLFLTMLEELKASSAPEGQDALETMHELVHGEPDPEDKDGQRRAERMRDSLNRALSLSGRVSSAKALTEVLEKLIRLEREAFGIKEEQSSTNDIDELLKKIGRGEV